MSEWQQIHAQIDAIVRAIPEHFLLDPPDGGDVTVAEGVQRMAARIEQLEAALREIADCKTFTDREYMIGIARAALEGK